MIFNSPFGSLKSRTCVEFHFDRDFSHCTQSEWLDLHSDIQDLTISCVSADEVEADIMAVWYGVSWPSKGKSESTRHSAQRRIHMEGAPLLPQVHSEISIGELATESKGKD